MGIIVLATKNAYRNGESAFRAAFDLDIRSAPAEEIALAEMVLATGARAVILGTDPYCGPLYEALGQTGGAAGSLMARFGVGHDSIDKVLARRHNIVVTNTPGVLETSVAEHALWLLGSLARRIPAADATFRSGQFSAPVGMELAGKTLGLIGFGGIGRRVGASAHFGFGMRVLAADPRPIEQLRWAQESSAQALERLGLELYTSDVDTVLRRADIVSLHLPATAATRHFFNADRLRLLKPGAMLVNTARGSVVDETALYDVLADGRLAGAALDVFEHEPYMPASPGKDLRTLTNVVLVPHLGSHTREAHRRMAEACLANVAGFFAGRLDEISVVAESRE
jgi:lactate dehydrogenase-like 2-hydroxyacid dehydrogenase